MIESILDWLGFTFFPTTSGVVICIIEHLEPGFVDEYCRGRPMTSNDVRGRLKDHGPHKSQ